MLCCYLGKGLRNHVEDLEQKMMDKDSKILDLEFKIEKTEKVLEYEIFLS